MKRFLAVFAAALGLVFWWFHRAPIISPATVKISPPLAAVPARTTAAVTSGIAIPPAARVTGHQSPPSGPPMRRGQIEPQKFGLKLSDFLTTRTETMNGQHLRVALAGAVPEHARSVDPAQAIGRVNGFLIVPSASTSDQPVVYDSLRPVLLNQATGRPEVVSGTLMVKVSGSDAADRIAGRNRLRILSYDDSIKIAYMQVPDGFPLHSGLANLRRDVEVLDIEVELLHGKVEAK